MGKLQDLKVETTVEFEDIVVFKKLSGDLLYIHNLLKFNCKKTVFRFCDTKNI